MSSTLLKRNSEDIIDRIMFGHRGIGKSAVIQELITCLFSTGGQVVLIDDSGSFRHSCKLLGGAYVEFSSKSNICLNPFSIISEEAFESDSEYREEVVQFLILIIGQMCRGPGTTDSIENAHIRRAISEVWRQYRGDATITNVAECLLGLAYKERKAHNLGFALELFSKGGSYSAFFEGRANLSLDNSYCAFEFNTTIRQALPCIAQRVMLMSLIFLMSEKMLQGEDSKITSLIINKVWDDFGDEQLQYFIHKASRRPKKHNGIFISGIQSVDDFYKNKVALLMLMNSSVIGVRKNG